MNKMLYADRLYNAGLMNDQMGNYIRATELYAISAKMAYAESGESMAFAYRLNNLAELQTRMGFDDTAYTLFKQMVVIQRKFLDNNSPELADGLYNLANAANNAGLSDEAIVFHKEALAIRESFLPSDETAALTADIVNSLHSLAFVYEGLGEYTEAIRYAESANEYLTGSDEYFTGCYYLAGLYDDLGHPRKAARLYRTVMEWIEQKESRRHSAYITVATRLAHSLARMGEYRSSLEQQREIQHILLEKSDENHLYYANCLRSMAILHKQLDEADQAEMLLRRAIEIKKRIMGDHERSVIKDYLLLLDWHLTKEQLAEALDLMKHIRHWID